MTTGFGVIERLRGREHYVTSGCIRVARYEWEVRLKTIFEGISELINEYRPDIVAVEKIFVHKNVASTLKLGQARGAAVVAAVMQDLSVAEYTPRQVKKTVVGYGAADKRQVQQMIKTVLGLSGLPQTDAADALAIAMCHSQLTRRIL